MPIPRGNIAVKALLFTFFLFSISIPAAAKSKRCMIQIPEPLLSLYLKSDLVITGKVKSETASQTERANTETNNWWTVSRTLEPLKTHKGKSTGEVVFINGEYRNSKSGIDEYEIRPEPRIGDEALFFLKKDDKDNTYHLTDSVYGIKKMDTSDLALFETRLAELKAIAGTKKNQLKNLMAWLMRLTEHKATRWDGAYVLNRSFSTIEDEDEEQPEIKPAPKPFILDRNVDLLNSHTIAKALTDSQKSTLSDLYYISVNDALSAIGNSDDYYYFDQGDESLAALTENWDKPRMATYLASHLQAAPISRKNLCSFLIGSLNRLLDDEHLYTLSRYFEDTFNEEGSESAESAEELLASLDEEIGNIEKPEPETPEPAMAIPEPPMGTRIDQSTIILDGEPIEPQAAQPEEERIEPEAIEEAGDAPEAKEDAGADKKSITYLELREQIMQRYLARFQKLASQGFRDLSENGQ